jgi:hypothetical protein
MRSLRVALVAGVAVLGLGACAPSEVDIKGLEKEIASGTEEQTGEKVQVDCPDSVDWDTGGTFECDVTTDGGPETTAEVTMENDDGDVAWKIS